MQMPRGHGLLMFTKKWSEGTAAEILDRKWRGAMYSMGQKRVAIETYARFEHSCADTIAEPGYPLTSPL